MRNAFLHLKNLSIVTIIVSVITGLILIIRPTDALKIVSIICGAGVIALGIGAWISYFAKFRTPLMAILGTISIIAGIFICAKYALIAATIVFLFGLFILISGIVDLLGAFDAKHNSVTGWVAQLVMSIITIIFSLVIIFKPFEMGVTFTRVIGIALIIYALMDLYAFVQVKRVSKILMADEEIDVNIVEDDEQ